MAFLSKCIRSGWPRAIRKILCFYVLLTTALCAAPPILHAQWGFFTSARDTYVLYNKGRQGLFFPRKEPDEQEITVGPVLVRPGLALSETYSSNLTLEKSDTREDFYTQLFPALLLHLPVRRNRFEAEYLGNFSWYSKNGKYDAADHYFAGRAGLALSRDSWLGLSQATALLHTPVMDAVAEVPLLDRRRRFNLFQNSATFQTNLETRLFLSLGFEGSLARFEKEIDQVDDFTRYHPSILMGYRFFRRMRCNLGYSFTDFDGNQTAPSSDYREHSLIFGVNWFLPSELSLKMNAKYNWLQYTAVAGSQGIWGADVLIEYSPRKRTTLSVQYQRFVNPTFVFSGDRPLGEAEQVAVSYTQDIARLALEYAFRERITFWLNFTYQRSDFPRESQTGTKRVYNIYGSTLQILYKFKPWLRLSILGGYSRNDSSIRSEEFEDTSTQVYIQTAF